MRSRFVPLMFLTVLTVASLTQPANAQLTQAEEAIAESIASRKDAAIALIERAVNINSGSLNLEGVREVGELYLQEFRSLGFDARFEDGAEFDRAGHVVATYGSTGPHFLMIGHLDTVFEPRSPFQRFERISEDAARGPGVIDMKGGNIIILEALRALRDHGLLDRMQVTVVLTGDEESSGRPFSLSRRALTDAADAADVALGFEDGDGNPATAVIARRGYSDWTLTVTGTPAHSSQIFRSDLGSGAIFETARILNGFREALAGEEFLTFNPGMILGGTEINHVTEETRGDAFGKNNVIAEHTVVAGDLRTISIRQRETAKERMLQITNQSLNGTSATLEFKDGYPPLAPETGNSKLLALLSQTSEDLGYGRVEAVNPANAGAADISFAAGRVEMALDGLGLMGDGGHTVDEVADLTTLTSQTQRAAILMSRLTAEFGTR